MELKDYRKRDFRPFCIEEIKKAFEHGIDPLEIELYMNDTDLDNMQLRQIRLGLESGIDVSAYARKTMFPEDMERIRLRLEQEKENRDLEKEEQDRIEKKRKKGELIKLRLSNTLSIFRILMILAILGAAALLFIGFRQVYELYHEDLYIDFRSETITLEYGDPFLPEDYIVSRSEGDSILVVYPSFSADELGLFTVTYQLSNGLKTIKKDLKINVIDSTVPVLVLNKEEVALYKDEDDFFVPEDYVKEAYDSCDEDPVLEVSKIDTNLDEQKVIFTLTDHSGNKAEASLKLILKDRPKSQSSPQSSTFQSQPVSSASNSENSSADKRPAFSEPTPSEPFKAEVYFHNVTVPLGSDPGTAAYSTYDGLSGNITISIQYPELNTSAPGTYPVYYINTTTGETAAVAYVTVTE